MKVNHDPAARATRVATLAAYESKNAAEEADLRRIRSLVSTGDPWRRDSALHVTGSALVVHPPSRRVLLRWHARQRAWLQIGGHADPGEVDPLAVAVREGREETGLADLVPWLDATLVHAVVVPVPGAAHEPAHEHGDLRYVLATDTPDEATPEKPSAALQGLSFAEAHDVVTEANLRETLARVGRLFGDVRD